MGRLGGCQARPADTRNWTRRRSRAHIPPVERFARTAAWVLPFSLLVLSIVAVPLRILDEQGLPRYRALKQELGEIEAGNDRLRRDVRALQRDVDALRTDPQAIERIARDELGMVREGEIVFQFPL